MQFIFLLRAFVGIHSSIFFFPFSVPFILWFLYFVIDLISESVLYGTINVEEMDAMQAGKV